MVIFGSLLDNATFWDKKKVGCKSLVPLVPSKVETWWRLLHYAIFGPINPYFTHICIENELSKLKALAFNSYWPAIVSRRQFLDIFGSFWNPEPSSTKDRSRKPSSWVLSIWGTYPAYLHPCLSSLFSFPNKDLEMRDPNGKHLFNHLYINLGEKGCSQSKTHVFSTQTNMSWVGWCKIWIETCRFSSGFSPSAARWVPALRSVGWTAQLLQPRCQDFAQLH